MLQIKEREKSNTTKRKHYEFEKASRYCQRDDDDYTHDTFDQHTKSISSRKTLKKEEEEEKQIEKKQVYRVLALETLIVHDAESRDLHAKRVAALAQRSQ